MRNRSRNGCNARGIAAFALLMLATSAGAEVLTVGASADCQFPHLQGAIDAVHGAVNVIRVAGNLGDEHPTIDGKTVTIVGGFANCSAQEPTGISVISELPHSGDSVLTIKNHSYVVLENLGLTDGHESDTGHGGGIDFAGSGGLTLRNVAVFDNRAGYGAGINVSADDVTEINLQRNTNIYANVAARAGGGIRVEGLVKLNMIEGDESAIFGNEALNPADGAGGGLQVLGSDARANLGSAAISDNHAILGGGISVQNGAIVKIFQTNPSTPSRIDHNTAVRLGGGVYIGADGVRNSQVLAFGVRIDGNVAANGAAIYVDVDNDVGGALFIERQPIEGALLDCPGGTPCNVVSDNTATQDDGAIVLVQSEAFYALDNIEFRRNRGGRVLQMFTTYHDSHRVTNCLVVDNTLRSEVVRVDEGEGFDLRGCTIANNVVGAPTVLSMSGDIRLSGSILMQPGKTILDHRSGNSSVADVIANEIDSLGGGTGILVADPKFLDAPSGNYHLAANSPALDFASGDGAIDLEGHTRTIDLPGVDNRPGGGPMDLGAYERQSAPPFPPNESFDEIAAPALADGWIGSHTGGTPGWYTATLDPHSAPNAAFVGDPAEVSDASLTSPPVTIDHEGMLTFMHRLGLEPAYDGAVLEISIDDAPFEDIIAAGGEFVQGGYTATIPSDFESPLAGRSAWEGSSGGSYRTVIVRLPPATDGRSVRFRWRVGTDNTNGVSGYWLDDVHVGTNAAVFDRIFCEGFDPARCR